MSHIMKNSIIYEKPWQSRRLITNLIGCGMLAAEGQVGALSFIPISP
jgi:hypothetical protein